MAEQGLILEGFVSQAFAQVYQSPECSLGFELCLKGPMEGVIASRGQCLQPCTS